MQLRRRLIPIGLGESPASVGADVKSAAATRPTPGDSAPPSSGGGDPITGGSPGSGTNPWEQGDQEFPGGGLPNTKGRASGVKRQVAKAPEAGDAWPQGHTRRSPVTFTRPQIVIEPAYFQEIPIAAPTIKAGEHAWFGLRRIRVPYETGSEISLCGIYGTLCSPDVNATGDGSSATASAWGKVTGLGACLVIGVNLPIQLDAWSSSVCYAPGLDMAGGPITSTLRSSSNRPASNRTVIYFPPGDFGSATDRNMFQGPIPVMGGTLRVRTDQTLDVAFVCARAAVNGVTGNIIGMANLELYLSPVDMAQAWQR